MKLNCWSRSVLCLVCAWSAAAQPSAPPPPPPAPPAIDITPGSAGAEPSPSAAPKKSGAPKKPKSSKPAADKKAKAKTPPAKPAKTGMILNPPVQAVVKCDSLDVRGHGSFAGEIITHLNKGETVTVLEEITLDQPKKGEPAHWSRILLPTNTPVWVDAAFVDPDSKTVKAKHLNVRGGPGENYSVVARVPQGTVLTEILKQKGWMEVEPPTNSSAFVASQFLESAPMPAAPVAVAAPLPPPQPVPQPEPAPQPAVVAAVPEPVAVASAPATAQPPAPSGQQAQELSALRRATPPQPATMPIVTPVTPPPPDVNQFETPRVVTREGYLRKTYNIQTPADFELHEIHSGTLLEYVQTNGPAKIKSFAGARVRLTGSESFDRRWPRTPIMQVQSVELMP